MSSNSTETSNSKSLRHELPKDTLEFLPAALEILERPASPASRWLGIALILLFTIGIVWASFGEVDIVAVADGKIIAGSRVKTIQPYEKGVVKTVYVSEGQRVNQGDPLVALDSTLTEAEQTRLRQELAYSSRSSRRKSALLTALSDENNKLPEPNSTERSTKELTRQKILLQQEWLEFQARLNTLKSQKAEAQAARQVTEEQVAQHQQTLPLITRRAEALKNLVARQMAPEMEYLQLEQTRIEQQQTLASLQAQLRQQQAAIKTVDQQLLSLIAETQSRWLTERDELERQQHNLVQELAKAEDLNAKQILYAPVSGRVQELAVNTIGGVVTEAQTLMKLVPDNDFLEVEAILDNKDIGFVFQGQSAEVKINTFNFTKYGVIDAEVIDVTADAIIDDVKGLVYKLRLRLDSDSMQIDQRTVSLLPGMAVMAEVKTGKRKLIEFVLSPLMRKVDESVGER